MHGIPLVTFIRSGGAIIHVMIIHQRQVDVQQLE